MKFHFKLERDTASTSQGYRIASQTDIADHRDDRWCDGDDGQSIAIITSLALMTA
jgi:hypothetical protein